MKPQQIVFFCWLNNERLKTSRSPTIANTVKSFGALEVSPFGDCFWDICCKPMRSISTKCGNLIVTTAVSFLNAKQFPGSILDSSIRTGGFVKECFVYTKWYHNLTLRNDFELKTSDGIWNNAMQVFTPYRFSDKKHARLQEERNTIPSRLAEDIEESGSLPKLNSLFQDVCHETHV
uniref:Uncharacterized protein n=1 Tax=Glossina pallidipes TaxID=7398 RepID=A0A1A9ZG61_GLOPL